ncbi:hypothetical protein E4V99_15300 [Microbacterium sp. dk485]|uniref:RNA polymerase sigma-70 region 2 domain-containing protein n=1 Tax=Microbacterium wangchenii TaxID=2541726 RepID=A0ABX5SV30_9MICO|nr:hypothetical protein E4K62_08220 [Microbacterium wangchenii]TFV82275.1 hypothetical protein E4V99_15300 [Microbacterium sp. dk485]TXK20398.1 hypothetical protein FVP99_01835 [Microbacterium wangchenii]
MAHGQHLQRAVPVNTHEADAKWATTVIEDIGVDLLRYLARRTAQEDVPDLLNDTLSVVWERRADLPRSSPEARMWAFGVARNTLRKHRHTHSKRTRSGRPSRGFQFPRRRPTRARGSSRHNVASCSRSPQRSSR